VTDNPKVIRQMVAAALGHGVPVITTRGAPWEDLVTYRCGWWIDTGAAALTEALRAATALPSAARRAMGERGRRYIERYQWSEVAREIADVYRWVLWQGDRPGTVRING